MSAEAPITISQSLLRKAFKLWAQAKHRKVSFTRTRDISKIKVPHQSLLNLLKIKKRLLSGNSYSKELNERLAKERAAGEMLTPSEQRIFDLLMNGEWHAQHVTKNLRMVLNSGKLLSKDERARQDIQVGGATPSNDGNSDNIFLSFGPGRTISNPSFLGNNGEAVDYFDVNLKTFMATYPECTRNMWCSGHFYAYHRNEVSDDYAIYGTKVSTHYQRRPDEDTGQIRYFRHVNYRYPSGESLTQEIEKGSEVFHAEDLFEGYCLMFIEKIRYLGLNAWADLTHNASYDLLCKVTQHIFHPGVLEMHVTNHLDITLSGIQVAQKQYSTYKDHGTGLENDISEAILYGNSKADIIALIKAKGRVSLYPFYRKGIPTSLLCDALTRAFPTQANLSWAQSKPITQSIIGMEIFDYLVNIGIPRDSSGIVTAPLKVQSISTDLDYIFKYIDCGFDFFRDRIFPYIVENEKNNLPIIPLITANKLDYLEFALQQGADVNKYEELYLQPQLAQTMQVSHGTATPLAAAICFNGSNAIRLMSQYSLDLEQPIYMDQHQTKFNFKPNHAISALYCAALLDKPQIMALFFELGLNSYHKNLDGLTILTHPKISAECKAITQSQANLTLEENPFYKPGDRLGLHEVMLVIKYRDQFLTGDSPFLTNLIRAHEYSEYLKVMPRSYLSNENNYKHEKTAIALFTQNTKLSLKNPDDLQYLGAVESRSKEDGAYYKRHIYAIDISNYDYVVANKSHLISINDNISNHVQENIEPFSYHLGQCILRGDSVHSPFMQGIFEQETAMVNNLIAAIIQRDEKQIAELMQGGASLNHYCTIGSFQEEDSKLNAEFSGKIITPFIAACYTKNWNLAREIIMHHGFVHSLPILDNGSFNHFSITVLKEFIEFILLEHGQYDIFFASCPIESASKRFLDEVMRYCTEHHLQDAIVFLKQTYPLLNSQSEVAAQPNILAQYTASLSVKSLIEYADVDTVATPRISVL